MSLTAGASCAANARVAATFIVLRCSASVWVVAADARHSMYSARAICVASVSCATSAEYTVPATDRLVAAVSSRRELADRRSPTASISEDMDLDAVESQTLPDTFNERSVDTAPAAVHATLPDEGRYRCSVPTLCRLLAANGGGRARRNQPTRPPHTKPEPEPEAEPELPAIAPNQVWSWDITKRKRPA